MIDYINAVYDRLASHDPATAAWMFVNFLGSYIWVVKSLSAAVVAIALLLLPPVHIRLAMWSRIGAIAGAGLVAISLTPIKAFGPLGDFIFWPCFATNISCLIWCRRATLMVWIANQKLPEVTLVRAAFTKSPNELDKVR